MIARNELGEMIRFSQMQTSSNILRAPKGTPPLCLVEKFYIALMNSSSNKLTMQNNFSFKSSRILTQIAVFLIPFYFFRFSIGPIKTNVFEVAVLVALLNTLYIIRYTKKVAWGSSWPYVFLLIAFVSIFPAYNKTAALGIFKGWFLVPIVLYWLIINLFGLSSSGRQRHDPGIQVSWVILNLQVLLAWIPASAGMTQILISIKRVSPNSNI